MVVAPGAISVCLWVELRVADLEYFFAFFADQNYLVALLNRVVFLLCVALRAVEPLLAARGVYLRLNIRNVLAHVKIDAKFIIASITNA